MNRAAKVTSIDAIKEFRPALIKFEAEAREAVTMLVLEVRKAIDWIEDDRTKYWPQQVREASDALVVAHNDLQRCELAPRPSEKLACTEQKKAVQLAKQRLRHCEAKVQAVRHWRRAVHQEMNEFQGQMGRMNNYLDSDIPRAIADLSRIVKALEKYAQSGGSMRSAGTAPRTSTSAPANESKSDSKSG